MKYFPVIFYFLALPAFAQQGQPGEHFVENWDLDGNGAVSVEEAAERRGDVFTTFDANEDGFLDSGEYVALDEARAMDMEGHGGHGRGGMQRASDGMMMVRNDRNGDGKVSRDEFVGDSAAWISVLDSDGDGVVTVGDFGRGRGRGKAAN